MQIVNVSGATTASNLQNLYDALTRYGTGYFTSYEVDTTALKIDCYIGDDVVLTIQYVSGNGVQFVYAQGTYVAFPTYYQYITKVIVCDNCIGLVPAQSYGGNSPAWTHPVFFTKKANGSTALVYPSQSTSATSIMSINVWSSSTFYGCTVGVISFDATTHEGRKKFIPVAAVNLQYISGEDATQINAFQLYDPYDGEAIKDFYFIAACGIHQQEPGYFSVDGVRYVGLAGYAFASKED